MQRWVAALLLVPGAVAAQFSATFTSPQSQSAEIDESLTVTLETRNSTVLVDTGTLAWSYDTSFGACDSVSPPLASLPTTPTAGGITSVTFSSLVPDFCPISVDWDPDGPLTAPAVRATPDPVYVGFNSLTPNVLVPVGTYPATYSTLATPTFTVEVRKNSTAIANYGVWYQVTDPTSMVSNFGSFCFPSTVTDASGQTSFTLPVALIPGSYTVKAEAIINSACKAGASAGPRPKAPMQASTTFTFTAVVPSGNTISITDPSNNSEVPIGQPVTVTVQAFDSLGAQLPGQVVDYSVTGISGPVASGSTLPTDASGQATFTFTAPSTPGALGVNTSLASDATAISNIQLNVVPTFVFTVTQPAGGVVTAAPGSTVPLSFSAVDANSVPAAGLQVNLMSDPPISSLPPFVLVDTGGVASTSFTAPPATGTYTISTSLTPPGKANGPLPLGGELITLTVANVLVANNDDFSASPVDGPSGGSTASVYGNDSYNGSTVPDTAVVASITTTGGLASVGISAQGNLTIPAGSGAGTYTVGYQMCEAAVPSNCASATAVVVVQGAASIALTLSASPAVLSAPAPINYTLVLSNTGAAPLTGVSISALLPDASSASLVGPSGDGGQPGVLEPGEAWTYTAQYIATAADISNGTALVSSASALATNGNSPISSNTATATTTIVNSLNTLEAVSGDNQQGSINTALGQPLIVVARSSGTPQAGVPVTWSVGANATLRTPSGAVGSSVTTTTAADGTAQVQVMLGPSVGSVTITASRDDAPGVSAGFVATAVRTTPILTLAAPASGSGNGASGAPGTSIAVAVQATRDGDPDSGIAIDWEVQGAGASASPANSTTGADGIARTSIVLDANANGQIVVRATRADGGGNAVTYVVNAVPGAPVDSLQAISGARQTGAPGAALADLVVRYTRDNLPVSGQAVSWTVTSGDAVLTGPTSGVTGSDGTTSIGARLGDRIGDSVVTATSGNLSATFVLTASTTRVISLRLISGGQQRGPVGTPADAPIVVEVFELVGGLEQPAPGRALRWSLVSGSASFAGGATSARTTSGGDGRSALPFNYGSTAGSIVFQVQLDEPNQVTQTLQVPATSFNPTLRIISGDGQSGAAGADLALPLVVGIGDPGTSKSLAGTIISWRVVSGGGQLGSGSSTTDAQGNAQNTLRLGPGGGPNLVEARLAGGAAVQFSANGNVAAGATLSIVSGSPQTLATNEPSAPLVVALTGSNNAPIAGARILWRGTNAEPRDAETVTGTNGQAQTTAVLFDASGGTVTALIEGSNLRAVFVLNGGVVETSNLDPDQRRNAELVDALCPALEALQASGTQLNAGQADLLARCLELEQSAGPRPQEVQQALTELVTQIATVLSDAALDTLRTQLGNHSVRFEQLRNLRHGNIAQNMGIGVWTPDGIVSLSLLPSSLSQAEGESEGGGQVGSDFDRWGFFATGTIGRGESRADSRTPEYDFDTSGITAGVDYRFTDQLVAGASLGYASHDTEMANDRGTLDTSGWTVSGYGTWYNERNWFVDGVLSYGSNSYDMLRRISYDITALGGGRTVIDQAATASTDSSQLGGSLSVGRDFQKGAWNLSTYLRGDYSRASFDGYSERAVAGSAGEGLVLTVDPRDLTSMAATLGGKATYIMSRDWGILMPHVQLELQQEFKDDPQRLSTRFSFDPTQTTALFEGQDIDSSLYNLGLGLSALFPGGKSAYLYYERLMGSSQVKQDTLSLGVRFEF